jgi:putative ABC transport system ATP-binding protein
LLLLRRAARRKPIPPPCGPNEPARASSVRGKEMNAVVNPAQNASPLIQLADLKKVFYTDEVETHALSGVHFEIQKGDYLSISGPSGCGKSTLLSILGLLDTPTEGRYVLNGTPVENLDNSQRAHIRNKEIGFIFQAFNLIGDLTVFENVELPLTYRAGMGAKERKERVILALERVRMAHRLQHYPSQLSGGQQQRVAVARALVGSPSILLADEPTGNLDSKNGEAVMALLTELHEEGATICIVTHDPRYAEYADRKIHMFDGRVVDEETLQRLREEEDRRIAEQARRGRPVGQAPAP